jgi:hypothetical protein
MHGLQAAVKALRDAELAYVGRHGQAMSTGWTGGQHMYFKKYALEHLVMLAGACNYTVDAPTTNAMKLLSNRVRCQQIQHDPCTWISTCSMGNDAHRLYLWLSVLIALHCVQVCSFQFKLKFSAFSRFLF